MKRLLTWFGNGLLLIIPIGGTIYVVYWLFTTIDRLVRAPLENWFGAKLVTGMGVVITLAFIVVVGYLGSWFIFKPLTHLIERLFKRMPLVKLLYSALQDLVGAFVGDRKRFDQPVLVELGGDIKVFGFITRESMAAFGLADEVAVYMPQSYNFAGNLLVVPRRRVTPLDNSSSDIMTLIVSAGISGPGTAPAATDATKK